MTTPDPLKTIRGGPRNRSIRLMFEYRNNDVKLISAQRLAMIAPPPQALVPRSGEAGSWLELRGPDELPLYRRAIDNPIQYDLEVIDDDPDRPLRRVSVKEPQGTFFIVVPDIPLARRFVLRTEPAAVRTSPLTRDEAEEAAGEYLHEFDLSGIDNSGMDKEER